MKYPTTLVLGQTTQVWLPFQGSGGASGRPEDYWTIMVNGVYYDPVYNPGGYNLKFVTNLAQVVGGVTTDGVVVDVYIIPAASIAVGPIYVTLYHKGPPTPPPGLDNYYRSPFSTSCMNVTVTITKESPESIPVPGTNPQEYLHRYRVSAATLGGTPAFIFVWSKSVIGGTLKNYSATGDSCILEVRNTMQTFEGITGTVTCDVTDSSSPTCSATDTADVAEATDPTTHCVPSMPDPATDQCACQTDTCQTQPFDGCKMGDGSNIVGPGNPDDYGGSWGGGGSRGGGSNRPGSGSTPTDPSKIRLF